MTPPLVAIGASAGGIEALRRLLPTLPPDFPAAVAIVLHRSPVEEDDRLPRVLAIGSNLPVVHAVDGEPFAAGHVYVAPAAVHLAIDRDRFQLQVGPRENNSRPSIDVLFRTAALACGSSAAGVILSGLLDDGTAGLAAIVAAGGCAYAQDPKDAQFPDMPRNAIANVPMEAVAPASDLGPALERFAARARLVPAQPAAISEHEHPSPFSCPACGGVLNEVDAAGVVRYRCRTGHAYSPRTLYERQEDTLETALWEALRALEERIDLSTRLAERSRQRGSPVLAARFAEQADIAARRAETVRGALGRVEDAMLAAEAESTESGVPSLSRP